MRIFFLTLLAWALTGCGGGGGSSATTADDGSVASASSSAASDSSGGSSSSAGSEAPQAGESRPMLVVRLEYTNETFTDDATFWAGRIFGDSEHQLNHYYHQNSNGRFEFTPALESHGTVNDGVISIALDEPHPDSGSSATIHSDLAAALNLANPYIDFAQYDTNGDQAITPEELIVMFLVAGQEDSYSGGGPENGVWAHRSCTVSAYAPLLDGVRLLGCTTGGSYALFGERHANHNATVGIIAHELGHAAFDLPDLYDVYGESAGIGYFGLMGSGMWGYKSFTDFPGNTPTHLCAWSKVFNGWYEPEVKASVIASHANLYESASANYNVVKVPIDANEYFLLENRNNTGYDAGLFALDGLYKGGMAVWHIDESRLSAYYYNNNIVNADADRKAVDLEEAAMAELDDDYEAPGHAQNLFYEGNVVRFTPTGTPDTSDNDGAASGISVYDISGTGEVMSATVTNPNQEL